MTDYRAQIRLSIQDLIITRRNILDSIENIVIQINPEYAKHWEDPYEVKEFREIKDINIERLIKIYDRITLEIRDMMLDNDFTYDDIGFNPR